MVEVEVGVEVVVEVGVVVEVEVGVVVGVVVVVVNSYEAVSSSTVLVERVYITLPENAVERSLLGI